MPQPSPPLTIILIFQGVKMDNKIGNLSTIVKWISMYIAGWAIGTLAAYGLNFPVDAVTLSQVISGLIFLGVGYVDSKYPNTFSFLDNDVIIEDIDPALEYEQDGDDDDGQ